MNNFKIPSSELIFSFSRSSGAGGQNVNKVNTKATLQWNIFANSSLPKDIVERFVHKYSKRLNENGIITIVSQKSRSQNLNSTDALEKLYAMINSVAVAPKIRKATKPSRSAVNKRLQEKKAHSDKKKSRKTSY